MVVRMNKKFNVTIGNKIEIYLDGNYYKSNIQDVDDSSIGISIPIEGGQYISARKGDNVEVIYYDKDSIYKFNSRVVRRENRNIPIIYLNFPNKFDRIQRRKYVRVSLVKYIKYMEVPREFRIDSVDNETVLNMKKAILLDISGGGTKIKIPNKLKKGGIILTSITMEEGNDILLKGQVVRCELDDDSLYECGINFIEMGSMQREKLIQHVFKIMREQIKKS